MIDKTRIKRITAFLSIKAACLGIFILPFHVSLAQQYKLSKVTPLYEIPGLKNVVEGTKVIQDRLGFIWIGSENGLYKFDGYSTIHYQFDPNQPEKLAGNWVNHFTEDDAGNLWIGVFGIGLQKFDPVTEKFTLYKADPSKPDHLFNSRIMDVVFHAGKLWIGTQEGLCRFSPQTGKFKKISGLPTKQTLVSGKEIWFDQWTSGNNNKRVLSYYDAATDSCVTTDTLSNMVLAEKIVCVTNDKAYINTAEKIYVYDLTSKKMQLLKTASNETVLSGSYMAGNLLISYSSGKLEKFNIEKETSVLYNLGKGENKKTIYLYNFFKLNNGDLWGLGNKFYKVLLNNDGIESYELTKNNQPLQSFSPTSFSEWLPGQLGIGKAILIDFNNTTAINTSTKYPALSYFDSAYTFLGRNTIVIADKNGDSWIAYRNPSPSPTTFFKFSYATGKLETLGKMDIQAQFFGMTKIDDDLWLANWRQLGKWNIPSSEPVFIEPGKDSTKLSSGGLRFCYKDNEGDLWVATQNGLNWKKKGQDYFTHFFARSGDTTALSFSSVSNIAQDASGNIWIGTLGGGLNKFNKKTGGFYWITQKQGLIGNTINNIVVDNRQNIWVSHENGISRIDAKTNAVDNFTIAHGVQPPYENLSLKMKDGSLIFGGELINRIWPDKVQTDTFVPPVFITHLKLFNKPVVVGAADSILHSSIISTKSITLNYDQNVISIEYTALDMSAPEKRMYAYQLQGFDPDWQYVENKREVTYTNLPPGDYTFKVKSASRFGLWHEMANPLHIHVLPPWWKTWWAYTLYAIFSAAAIWAFITYRSRRLKKENVMLEEKVSLRTNELSASLKELKATQSQLIQSEKMASLGELTAGIAHEIQNPLNFVNNFSEVNKELLVELKDEIKKGNLEEVNAIADDVISNEEKINHHGRRADAIVKGMLQHSRSTSATKEPTDINKLADEYLRLAYHGLRAKDKSFNATLKTDFDETIGNINIIPQDMGRVILNLITNAFYVVDERFRQAQRDSHYYPTVSVGTKKEGNKVLISVKDNGNGIPQKILDKIFQPFFTTKPTGQGTGLGLSLSYDIVKAHGGELKVETKEGEGTTFLITLPI